MAIWTRSLRAAVVLPMIAGTQLAAQTPTDLIRIRPESSLLCTVVAAAFDRSAIFRSLIDRIDHSDGALDAEGTGA